jgi:hypothetical protein
MTIENNDRLLVNRGEKSHQIKYEKIKDDIVTSVDQFPEAPVDGKQYGREDGNWTEITHTTPYTDADVDAHLNTNTAQAGEVLMYDNGDYAWRPTDQIGGGGGNNYTYPGGVQRTVQSRLEDYVSVKDFGAKGDGVTDDTVAVRAALTSGNADIHFPRGTYKITSQITLESGISIYGEGSDSIILYSPPNDGDTNDGLLQLKYDNPLFAVDDVYSLRNISLLCDCKKSPKFGLELYYTGPSGVVGQLNKLILDNVDIASLTSCSDPDLGYFQQGLRIINAGGVVASNLNIYTNNDVDQPVNSEERDGTIGINIVNILAGHAMIRTFSCTNFYLQRYNTCLRTGSSAGGTIESIYLVNGEILGSEGVVMSNTSATCILSTHFDTTKSSYINTSTAGTHRVIGCDVRNHSTRGGAAQYDGYTMNCNSPNTIINGNFILANLANKGAIEVGGSPDNINISGNIIEGRAGQEGYQALYVAPGAQRVVFGGNTLNAFDSLTPWNNDPELFVYGQRGI